MNSGLIFMLLGEGVFELLILIYYTNNTYFHN